MRAWDRPLKVGHDLRRALPRNGTTVRALYQEPLCRRCGGGVNQMDALALRMRRGGHLRAAVGGGELRCHMHRDDLLRAIGEGTIVRRSECGG